MEGGAWGEQVPSPPAPTPGLGSAAVPPLTPDTPTRCPLDIPCPAPLEGLPSLSRPYVSIVHGRACGGTVHGGRGAVMVQADNEHLGSFLHQGFPVVREEQVVVGDLL